MQANASAQGVVFLFMGCRCHGGIGSDLMMELMVIDGSCRLSQFVDSSESSFTVACVDIVA